MAKILAYFLNHDLFRQELRDATATVLENEREDFALRNLWFQNEVNAV